MAPMDRSAVAAIAALDDDVRRALFTCVRDAAGPVTREDAAAAVGISRKLAAFHLDKLVAAGLLTARTAATHPPRVGRAPKAYEPSGQEVAVSLPQREHTLLAEILLSAVRDERDGESPSAAVQRAAHERGLAEGSAARPGGRLGVERALGATEAALRAKGFQPLREDGEVRLRNCPFHPLAEQAPEVVCTLNHAYVCGLLEGLGADAALCADLAPTPGHCCVTVAPRAAGPDDQSRPETDRVTGA